MPKNKCAPFPEYVYHHLCGCTTGRVASDSWSRRDCLCLLTLPYKAPPSLCKHQRKSPCNGFDAKALCDITMRGSNNGLISLLLVATTLGKFLTQYGKSQVIHDAHVLLGLYSTLLVSLSLRCHYCGANG